MNDRNEQPGQSSPSPLDRLRRRQPPLLDAQAAERGRQARVRRVNKQRERKAGGG